MHECARGGMDDDDAVNDDVDDDVDETHRADDETYFHPSRRRVVSPSRASRRHPSRASILPSSYRGRISRARMHATHLREHGAGDAEGERALGHLFGEFVQTRASGDGLGGSVVRSSRARRQSSPVRSSARAREPLLVARERSRAGTIDPSTASTTPCRRRARARARRERVADEEKFPHLKPPLRRPRTRPARASRIVEIATDRSRDPLAIVRSVVDRASSAPSSHRARTRGARDTHTRTAWWPSPP